MKYTINKHTDRVGIIIGLNLEQADFRFYKQLLMKKASYNEKVFEIEKKRVFERDMELKYFVVYAILSKRDNIDRDLQ